MTYGQARAQLARWTVRAIQPGLERTHELLDRLDRPDARLPAIQITGTNGKGSVAAFVAQGFQAQGYRVGRYTSPHLEDERERIAIQGRPVTRAAFVRGVGKLLPHLRRLHAQGRPATRFEAWTVLAALSFKAARVQIAVLEVGMGGRWDATTAWQDVRLSLLTHVALEHTQELGRTRRAIAAEKFGLTRPGVRLLLAEPDPGLRRLFQEWAELKAVPVEFAGRGPKDAVRILDWRPTGPVLDTRMDGNRRSTWHLGLPGEHQAANAALALLALKRAEGMGFPVSAQAMRSGLARVKWPGRLERVRTQPAVFLDGAHNPDAARALAHAFHAQAQRVQLVMGVMQDKDVARIIGALAPVVQQVWTVTAPDPRALAAEPLARRWRQLGLPARACASYRQALRSALAAAGPRGQVLVAGSLYNIAPVRRALRGLGPALD